MSSTERVFNTGFGTIKAQQWNPKGRRKMLALHGWLDNSASFTPLAMELEDVHLVAVDLPGHGLSSHYVATQEYLIWADLPFLIEVLDTLEWHDVYLIGHSRGAAIATLLTAIIPDRIKRLIWLDGGAPLVESNNFVQQLEQSVHDQLKLSRPVRIFDSIDIAVKARQRGLFKLSETSAQLLTERGTKAVEGGFSWSADTKLMNASSVRLTAEQISQAMTAITCPIYLVLANSTYQYQQSRIDTLIHRCEDVCFLEGDHHFHMEQAQQVARLVTSWCN